MKNRFDGILKKKTSKEDFILGALEDAPEVISKKKPNKENILLTITGKMKREDCGEGRNLFLRKDIEEDIQEHCRGSMQSVVNYLLKLGIEVLKKEGKHIFEDID